MGVVIESFDWEPNPRIYVLIFCSCFISTFLLPFYAAKSLGNAAAPFDHGLPSSLLRAQRRFLLLYSLASLMVGFWSVFGELEFVSYDVGREWMVIYLCIGYLAAVAFGTFSGMLGDLFGHKKLFVIFWILHLFTGIWKKIAVHSSVLVGSIALSLADSIFSVSFETWMVIEHEKLGHRLDTFSDMFWLMTFAESASFIGSQMLANWLVDSNLKGITVYPPIASIFLAVMGIIYSTRGWTNTKTPHKVLLKNYMTSFSVHIFGDKRIWLLLFAQAWIQFSIAVLWILWAPTMVADGREVNLGLIHPCFLGARMLGATAFPWLISQPSLIQTEDYLVYVFIVMGVVFSIIAYDYQEIEFLVALFCIFHACIGLVVPSLARLRSIYVPNDVRGGMLSLSLALGNSATLFFLLQGGYYQNLGNAAIMAFAAIGLFAAAGCMHMLQGCREQTYRDTHRLL